MPYTEEDIAHEDSRHWVLRDRPAKRYSVCVAGITHSTVDSSYELSEDGLSIAIARCRHLAKRAAAKPQ
jgi:hypothetical protein